MDQNTDINAKIDQLKTMIAQDAPHQDIAALQEEITKLSKLRSLSKFGISGEGDVEYSATKVITAKLAEARRLIEECEEIAEVAGTTFSFSLGYGMGGHYVPPSLKDDPDEGWQDSGWISSSSSC